MRTKRICRHCQERYANRSRGLCWRCYHAEGVKDQFEPLSHHGRRGVGLGNPIGRMPPPTDAVPGSAEKIAVLHERASLGLALWHPLDRAAELE